jgi:hypothetical protein
MASLQKNVASQNVTFCMVAASNGSALSGASVSVLVTKDNGAQASGGGTVTGLGSGQYNYAPTQAETNAFDVGFFFTATGAIPLNIDFHTDPANFQSLSIDANGNIAITSNIKKNTAFNNFMFIMTDSTTHTPKTGLGSGVSATRSLDGGVFSACANSVSEISNGWYQINLATTDTNGNRIALRFSAASADDTDIEINTQP